MKCDLRLFWLILVGVITFLPSCSSDTDNASSLIERLYATFSVESDQLTATTGQEFVLIAYTTPESKVSNKWYIDDVLESTATTLKYKFNTPGTKKVRYIVKNEAGEFSKEFTVKVTDVLVVNLSIGDVSFIERHLNSELEVVALVSAGTDITHQWEVDETVVSNDRILDRFMLTEKKTYKVKYTATNAVGNYVKEFEVRILGLPLDVDFSIKDTEIRRLKGKELEIVATIIDGAEGAVHEWKIGDTTVSSTDVLAYDCNEDGTFEIVYNCKNAAGDKFSRTWKLNVIVGSFMLDDFEKGWKDIYRGGGNDAVVEIVDNPLKTDLNTSSKVLKVTKSFGSQQLNVYIKRAANPTVDITADVWSQGFDRVRFMYYNPIVGSSRFVSWKYNGGDPVLTLSPQPLFGVWSYAELDLTTGKVNGLTSMNLRLNDGGQLDDIVYVDNIEFYNSDLIKD